MIQTLQTIFKAQVEKTPNNIAMRDVSKIYTYQELYQHAHNLSSLLKTYIHSPETLVAIRGQRSTEFIIAILGVLLAGGTYLPLDLLYDPVALEKILKDAQPKLIIDICDQEHSIPYEITVNSLKNDEKKESNNDSINILPSHLAYILYTSGVTGDPKGVMIEHRSVCSRMEALQGLYSITENDVFFHNSPYGFDGSIEEIFLPLLSGSQLVIAPPGKPQDMLESLLEYIERYKVTTLNLMPSLWAKFADVIRSQRGRSACHSLKRLIGGGDTLFPHVLQEIQSILNIDFYYIYGPTENTINTTLWSCRWSKNMSIVPVGYALPQTSIHILDHNYNPLSQGEIGTIYLSGIGLARGYINKHQLTNLRFNSFGHNFRLYNTRDIGRILPGGLLEYIGRKESEFTTVYDYYNVAKAESFLATHADVNKVIFDVEQNGRLTSYVSLNKGTLSPEEEQCQEELLRKYLIPFQIHVDEFVFVPSFPYSVPGKIDLRTLQDKRASSIHKISTSKLI